MSDKTLLTILSNSAKPSEVAKNLEDCFNGLQTITFKKDDEGNLTKQSDRMISLDGEFVMFKDLFNCVGEVEDWLRLLEKHTRDTLKSQLNDQKGELNSLETVQTFERQHWIDDKVAQLALLLDMVSWTEEVNKAFEDRDEGNDDAMRSCFKATKVKLDKMIDKVIEGAKGMSEDAWKALKCKTIAIITIQVHERDIVSDLVTFDVKEISSFRWQSQLRFEITDAEEQDDTRTAIAKVCDWSQEYKQEQLGNSERLVITPLTDRCYITLTQALSLIMGGAPQGPAGTGKTETTKDLGKALGLPVQVFNCSKQMTSFSVGNLFKGLSQAGAWGCFDEFNTIRIEVLSIVANQALCSLTAVKAFLADGTQEFNFIDDDRISIVRTVGFFITMNPGQKGRAELPESIKVQFRPCAMIKADFKLIAENMLMSEGFRQAKELSSRFVTLYGLSEELLSFNIHYDWRLRAMKSLLRMAGKLKRFAKEGTTEFMILKNALKNFNLPRVVTDDKPIFEQLCQDLFPNTPISQEPDKDMMAATRALLQDPHYIKTYDLDQRDENEMVLKVVQMAEILEVRHCMFVIGPAGCGKSAVIKTLVATWNKMDFLTRAEQLNPKSIERKELFGYVDPKVGWKNGVLSSIMRNQCKNENGQTNLVLKKYMVLDGDIDPEWIEAMNTVMDDNKVLTLASNERIAMTPAMRMILEIEDMRNATPATASRGGCLCINETDIGQGPQLVQWKETILQRVLRHEGVDGNLTEFRNSDENNLMTLIKTQVELCQDSTLIKETFMETFLKDQEPIVPIMRMAICQTITTILDSYFFDSKQRKRIIELRTDEERKQTVSMIFQQAAMWAFGGITSAPEAIKFFESNFRNKVEGLPKEGNLLDYYQDMDRVDWVHWNEKVPTSWENVGVTPLLYFEIIIPNLEIYKMSQLMELHQLANRSVCLVGSVGTGKSTFIKYFLENVSQKYEKVEKIGQAATCFNQQIDSMALQNFIMGRMEKKQTNKFGPKEKKIFYFIDDLNMAFADVYETQSAIELLKQIVDYKATYNREELDQLISLDKFLFVCTFNPKMGSGRISNRTQRFFTTIAITNPTNEAVNGIQQRILQDHLKKFDPKIKNMSEPMVVALTKVFQSILINPKFSPTARKFHQIFNLRDISRVIEGLLTMKPDR